MAETGLIERAAALLRQQEAAEPVTPVKPAGGPALRSAGPELVLDRGRLAGFGIAIPSAARSRIVEEFRLIKRNLIAAWSQNDLRANRRASRLVMVTSARPGGQDVYRAQPRAGFCVRAQCQGTAGGYRYPALHHAHGPRNRGRKGDRRRARGKPRVIRGADSDEHRE